MTKAAATAPIMAPFENGPALPPLSLGGGLVGNGGNDVDVVMVVIGVVVIDVGESVVSVEYPGELVGVVSGGIDVVDPP